MQSYNNPSKNDKNPEPNSGYLLLYPGKDPKDVQVKQLWYKGDSRLTVDIFRDGFTARGTNLDVLSHVNPVGEQWFYDSAYIATSTSKDAASQFPKDSFQAFVYELNPQTTAVDVSHTIHDAVKNNFLHPEDAQIYLQEKEMAVPYKIKASDIKGAWRVEVKPNEQFNGIEDQLFIRSITNEYISNPNYANALASKILHTAKAAGHGLAGVGVTLDGISLYDFYEKSKSTGDFGPFFQEGARIVGGWSGAITLGKKSAEIGAMLGRVGGPVGMATGAVVGGVVGSTVGYIGGGIFGEESYDLLKVTEATAKEGNLYKIFQQIQTNNPISIESSHKIFSRLSTRSNSIQALHEKSHRSILQMLDEGHRAQLRRIASKIAFEMRSKLPESEESSESDIQKNWLQNRRFVLSKHFEKLNIRENSAEASFLSYMVSEAYFYQDNISFKNSKITTNDYVETNQNINGLKDTLKKEMEDYKQQKGNLFAQETQFQQEASQLRANTPILRVKRYVNKWAEHTNTIGWIAEFTGNSKLSFTMFTGAQALTLLPTAFESGAKTIETLTTMFSAGTSISFGALSSAFTATTPIFIFGSLIQQIFSGNKKDKRFDHLIAWLSVAIQHLDRKLDHIIKGIGILEEHLVELHKEVNLVLKNIAKLGEFIVDEFSKLNKKAEESHTLLAQTSRQITSENAATQAIILEWWGSHVQSYNEKLQRAVKKGGKALDNFLENHFDNEFVNAKQVVKSKAVTSADKDLLKSNVQSLLSNLRDPKKFYNGKFLDVYNAINLLQEYAMFYKDEEGAVLAPNRQYKQLSHMVGLHILINSLLTLAKKLKDERRDIRAILPDDLDWLEQQVFNIVDFIHDLKSNNSAPLHKLIQRTIRALKNIQQTTTSEIELFEQEKHKQLQNEYSVILDQELQLLEKELNWGRTHYTYPPAWKRPIWETTQLFEKYLGFHNGGGYQLSDCTRLVLDGDAAITLPGGHGLGNCRYYGYHHHTWELFLTGNGHGHFIGATNLQGWQPMQVGYQRDMYGDPELQHEILNAARLVDSEQQSFINAIHDENIHLFKIKKSSLPNYFSLDLINKEPQEILPLKQYIRAEDGKGFMLRLPTWFNWNLFVTWLKGQNLGIGYLDFVYSVKDNVFKIDFYFVYKNDPDHKIHLARYEDDLTHYIRQHTNPGSFEHPHSIYQNLDRVFYYWYGGYFDHPAYTQKIHFVMRGGGEPYNCGGYQCITDNGYAHTGEMNYPLHILHSGHWNETGPSKTAIYKETPEFQSHQLKLQLEIDAVLAKYRTEFNLRLKSKIIQEQWTDLFELHFRVLHHFYMMSVSSPSTTHIHNIFLKIANAADRTGLLDFSDNYQKIPNKQYLVAHLQNCIDELSKLPSMEFHNPFVSNVMEMIDELRSLMDAPVTNVNPQNTKLDIEDPDDEIIDLDSDQQPSEKSKPDPLAKSTPSSALPTIATPVWSYPFKWANSLYSTAKSLGTSATHFVSSLFNESQENTNKAKTSATTDSTQDNSSDQSNRPPPFPFSPEVFRVKPSTFVSPVLTGNELGHIAVPVFNHLCEENGWFGYKYLDQNVRMEDNLNYCKKLQEIEETLKKIDEEFPLSLGKHIIYSSAKMTFEEARSKFNTYFTTDEERRVTHSENRSVSRYIDIANDHLTKLIGLKNDYEEHHPQFEQSLNKIEQRCGTLRKKNNKIVESFDSKIKNLENMQNQILLELEKADLGQDQGDRAAILDKAILEDKLFKLDNQISQLRKNKEKVKNNLSILNNIESRIEEGCDPSDIKQMRSNLNFVSQFLHEFNNSNKVFELRRFVPLAKKANVTDIQSIPVLTSHGLFGPNTNIMHSQSSSPLVSIERPDVRTFAITMG